MRIVTKLAALCAALAVLVACVTVDPQGLFSGDEGDDEVAASVAGSLSSVLPAARTEPELVAPGATDLPFVNDDQAPKSRLTVLDIFRPPRRSA